MSPNQIYKRIFVAPWPEWIGGLILGIFFIIFSAWALTPFNIYGGYYNWGSWFYKLTGLSDFFPAFKDPASPLMAKMSVGNLGFLLGVFSAAILAGEFKLKGVTSKTDYIEAVLGGFVMALGVVFAWGCNFGGFFSAITALSLNGFAMMLGLIVGGFLGSLYVNWRAAGIEILELIPVEAKISSPSTPSDSGNKTWLPILLILIPITLVVLINYYYSINGAIIYSGILFIGLFIGFTVQRSRLCFTTAFRDLFNKKGEFLRSLKLQRAIVLGLIVAAIGIAALKANNLLDKDLNVSPVGWINVMGGILFGFGMVIAGACGSGMLWRTAEGHLKLVIALVVTTLAFVPLTLFIWNYAPALAGPKIFIPTVFGWPLGLLFIIGLLSVWLLILRWIEHQWRGRK
ncbi:MAG: YeeE/YedE thiosulfate transporter family protein [Euryarchaeota archaeon]|nr:YeeE/YedE thiosulfate transporter family protein [Euryarchaeota archaeon]